MRSVEADGRTIDLAIGRALGVLGAERDDVHVDIIEGGSPGVLGIGRRAARVRATMREPIADWLAVEPPPKPAPVAVSERPPSARKTKRTPAAAPRSETIDPIELVQEIFRRLVVDVTVTESGTIEVPGEPRSENVPPPRLLSVVGADVEAVLGRKGEVLEAIEYLLNRMLDHAHATQRVALEAPTYRVKRRGALEDVVRRMAARARERKRPVTLDPLGPGDRRIVLELLKGERGVTAKTSGLGFYRKQTLTAGGAARKGGRKKAR